MSPGRPEGGGGGAPAASTLRAVVDRRLCVGTSNCAEESPDAFEMDERGAPVALSGASDEALKAAAAACPVGAIRLVEVNPSAKVNP